MCTKLESVQPKCVYCKGAYPANYRGCNEALLKQKAKDKSLRTKVHQKSSKQLPSIYEKYRKPTTVSKKHSAKPAATSVDIKGGYQRIPIADSQVKVDNTENLNINLTLQMTLNKLESFDVRIKKLEQSIRGCYF